MSAPDSERFCAAQDRKGDDSGEVRPTPSGSRNVVLFGGLEGAPIPSMERYVEALRDELPATGWNARQLRGKARFQSGSRAIKLAGFEFGSRVMYPLLARRQRADVFHITDHSFGHLINALPGDRTVITCHDLMPWMVPEIFARRLGRTVGLPLWERSVRAMRDAAHVVCDSTRTMKDVVERVGVLPERVSVVPLAASGSFVRLPDEQRHEARLRFGFADDACIVIHTGSSAAYKNVEAVIRTVGLLRSRGIRAEFAKVGPLTSTQTALVSELGLQDVLHLYSGVPDAVLCALYNAADVMVFPSRYEGFGLPPVEAMKAGLPVVISTAEALIETTGGHALAVDSSDTIGMCDAVATIWERRGDREAATEAGRVYADGLTWARTAREMARVYSSISMAEVEE